MDMPSRLIALLYVCNDVAQVTKAKRGGAFIEAFGPVLPGALELMARRPETKAKAVRTVGVWRQRQVFRGPELEKFDKALGLKPGQSARAAPAPRRPSRASSSSGRSSGGTASSGSTKASPRAKSSASRAPVAPTLPKAATLAQSIEVHGKLLAQRDWLEEKLKAFPEMVFEGGFDAAEWETAVGALLQDDRTATAVSLANAAATMATQLTQTLELIGESNARMRKVLAKGIAEQEDELQRIMKAKEECADLLEEVEEMKDRSRSGVSLYLGSGAATTGVPLDLSMSLEVDDAVAGAGADTGGVDTAGGGGAGASAEAQGDAGAAASGGLVSMLSEELGTSSSDDDEPKAKKSRSSKEPVNLLKNTDKLAWSDLAGGWVRESGGGGEGEEDDWRN